MNLTIRDLVDENYVYARALSYLGIDFYEHPDRTLVEVCRKMGLNKDQVLKTFYLFDRSYRFSFRELKKYPLEIVIEYLKHSHHVFIKDKLPYIARLVNQYPGTSDLRLIFPDFVEEFINHIYEEEDTLFNYLSLLLQLEKGTKPIFSGSLSKYEGFSLRETFRIHKDEDELEGIRNLLDESESQDLHWQVICKEIKAFDREMWYHSEIENKILFPKSIVLEKVVTDRIRMLSGPN